MDFLSLVRAALNGFATDEAVALRCPIELEFRSVGYSGERKNGDPEKNPQSKDENQQPTLRTHDGGSRNQTQVTPGGGEFFHHYVIPVGHIW